MTAWYGVAIRRKRRCPGQANAIVVALHLQLLVAKELSTSWSKLFMAASGGASSSRPYRSDLVGVIEGWESFSDAVLRQAALQWGVLV